MAAVALIAAVAIPAVASGKGAVEARFVAESSHGYKLRFIAEGRRNHLFTTVAVSRLTHGRKAYEAVTDISDRRTRYRHGVLRSRVGSIRIKVRFKPGVHSSCAGRFVGKIRYRGDHGFTRLSLHRTHGQLVLGHRCTSRAVAPRELPVDATLVACGNRPGGSVNYFVYRPRPRQAAHLTTRYEFAGRHAATIRDMGTLEPAKTFVAAPDFLSATVHPHTLYSGSADYADSALTGDLRADLPGRNRPTPLTPLSAALGGDGVTSDCGAIAAAAPGAGARLSPTRGTLSRFSRLLRSR